MAIFGVNRKCLVGVIMCLSASCGTATTKSPSEPVSSEAPDESSTNPTLAPQINDPNHASCLPLTDVRRFNNIVEMKDVAVEPDVTRIEGSEDEFVVLRLDSPALKASRPSQVGDDGADSFERAYAGASTPMFDDQILRELLQVEKPVLLTSSGLYSLSVVIFAGEVADDGAIHLLGGCGSRLSTSIEQVAAEVGVVADAAFYLAVGTLGTPEYRRLVELYEPTINPVQKFDDTDPAQRSLHLQDIPIERRVNYRLVALKVVEDEGVPSATVSLRTLGGLPDGFFTGGGVTLPLPIMIPRDSKVVELYFDIGAGPVLAATIPAGMFDEHLGSVIYVRRAGDGLSLVVQPMEPGQLEKELSMSREEIEVLRESLLTT